MGPIWDYDLPLKKAICDAVEVPVIISGGASTLQHILEAFPVANAGAALAAGMFHRGEYIVARSKVLIHAFPSRFIA